MLDRGIDNGAKIMFSVINLETESGNKPFTLTNLEIGERMGANQRSVYRWIKSLREAGYIHIIGNKKVYAKKRCILEISRRTNAKTDSDCFVYLMKNIGTNKYKIGYSIHPEKRARSLSTPINKIIVIYSVNGGIDEERILHYHFKDMRIAGEWFEFKENELNCVKIKMKEIEQK